MSGFMQDGQIDYSKYSLDSLEECLVSIDRNRFPVNFNAIKSEIESRTGPAVRTETDLKVQCPSCNQELGWWALDDEDRSSFVSGKSCPHCQYTAK